MPAFIRYEAVNSGGVTTSVSTGEAWNHGQERDALSSFDTAEIHDEGAWLKSDDFSEEEEEEDYALNNLDTHFVLFLGRRYSVPTFLVSIDGFIRSFLSIVLHCVWAQ